MLEGPSIRKVQNQQPVGSVMVYLFSCQMLNLEPKTLRNRYLIHSFGPHQETNIVTMKGGLCQVLMR